MFPRWFRRVFLGALIVVQLPGCAHLCHKAPARPCPTVSRFVPGPSYPVQPLPQVQPPLGAPGSGLRMYAPEWRPAPDARPPMEFQPPGARLTPPEWRAAPETAPPSGEPPLADPANPRAHARLLPPVFQAEPPAGTSPSPSAGASTSPPLPVGIPQFTMAQERIATGLKPLLDGLDWLQANSYRTVLHLRAPGQDDSADRREVEKRGLKYLAIEVGSTTLTRALVEEFSKTVRDANLQPLFVYDKDGRLTGSFWYLHFRTVEKANDDLARSKAGRLGLREDGDDEQRLLWLAIQKLLSEWGGS